MANSYPIMGLIEALEDVIHDATPVPLSKKSMVDVTKISDIVADMRMQLPTEIRQAQNVVDDKNRIIAEAKREAESIIKKAEQRRAELIEENEIMKETRKRATEIIASTNNYCSELRTSTNDFADKMLGRVQELLAQDLNNINVLRKSISSNNELKPAQAPQPQQVQQSPKSVQNQQTAKSDFGK